MLEKRRVLEFCIKAQEEKIEDLKQSLEKTQQSAVDAVGSMVSWSDTTKFQQSNLALGIQKRLEEAKLTLGQLETLCKTVNDAIFVGALFSLKNTSNGEVTNYLLVREGGGDSFDIEGEKIMFVSVSAPIAKAVIGKKKGDKVSFQDKVLEIVEVQ